MAGRPDGLLSHWHLLGHDGHSVLHYIQDEDADAVHRFVPTGEATWTRTVEDAEPELPKPRPPSVPAYTVRSMTSFVRPYAEQLPVGSVDQLLHAAREAFTHAVSMSVVIGGVVFAIRAVVAATAITRVRTAGLPRQSHDSSIRSRLTGKLHRSCGEYSNRL